ncbi:MAG: efflux RND transporter periplasmic adaptor subunit [Candidatus Moraniibacteriota bacterium]
MFKTLFTRLENRPILSFVTVVVILFGTIAFTHWLQSPKPATALPEKAVKTSRLFIVGSDQGRVVVSAQVKKSGVTDIVAVAPGVIKSIAVRPGQAIAAGQTLATLTSDYNSGATALTIEKARLQTDFSERTFAIDKEIIELERRIARADDTKTDREEKVSTKNLKIELERLRLSRSSAALDFALAERSDAALKPKSLTSGTVEYVAVRPGDLVSPGTVLMTVRNTTQATMVEAMIPKTTADALIDTGIALMETIDSSVALSQGYVSRGENGDGLVVVTYPLLASVANTVAQNSFVTLELPLRAETERGFLIPIDVIRSASNGTSVITMNTDHQTGETSLVIGETIGASVLVKSGLEKGMAIVLETSVLPGETIEPIR